MISVIMPCYSRQAHLDKSLPKWAAQVGVDLEIIVGYGPSVFVPPLANVRAIPLPFNGPWGLNAWNNELLRHSKGDRLLITMCDIVPLSTTQIHRMTEVWKPGHMVTERFFRENERDMGVWLQCMLVEKALVEAAGLWDEEYDKGIGWEDTDLVGRMLAAGGVLSICETPQHYGVYHIPHDYEYRKDPEYNAKYARNKARFHSRNKESVMEMLARNAFQVKQI